MPLLDLGVSYNEAKVEGDKQKLRLTIGQYKLMCKEVALKKSSKDTPQAEWSFDVVDNVNPDFNGKQLKTWTPLPVNGNLKGIGFLVDVTAALGKPWTGDKLNTDDYITKTCLANIIIDEKTGYNRIESFV